MDLSDGHSFDLGSVEAPLSPELNFEEPDLSIERPELCTPSNLDATANYINTLLTAHNYPVPLIFDSNEPEDQCKIVNCIYAMLKDMHKSANEQTDLEETISDMKRTQNDLQARLGDYQQDLEASRRENAQLWARIETSNKALKEETEKCRAVKEELSRAKHNMQYMKSQYAHETRRHETEQAKIKERLYKLMDERQKCNVTGMVINEPLPSEDNDMGMSEEKAMYSDLLQKSSNREQNARLETDKLRELVTDIYRAVSHLLATQIANYKDSFPSTANADGTRDYPLMRLPLDIGGTAAIARTHDLLVRLKEEWDHQITRRKAYSEEDMARKDDIIERLEQSNDELVDAIQQLRVEFERKASMYMRFADRNFFDNINPSAIIELSDSEGSAYEDDERAELSLRRTRRFAMKEQEKITAEAIRLGDERRKLAAERWAFEDMKRELTMQELVNGASDPSPPGPSTSARRQSYIESLASILNDNSRKRRRP